MSDAINKTLMGFITLIIGLVLIPVMSLFVVQAQANGSVGKISGLSYIILLVAYIFAFGLIIAGIKTMIAHK